MRRALTLLALFFSACSFPALRTGWATPADLSAPPVPGEDTAPAVVLFEEERTLMDEGSGDRFYTQWLEHRVIRVQKEGGKWSGQVKLFAPAESTLVALMARVTQPDGGVEELDPSALLAATQGKEAADLDLRAFVLPSVGIGSVVEYVALHEKDTLWSHDETDAVRPLPVRRAVYSLEVPHELVIEAAAFNSERVVEKHSLEDGRTELALTLEGVKASPTEDFAPHPSHVDPRWAWRLTGFDYGGRGWYTRLRDWKDVVKDSAVTLTVGDGTPGSTFVIDTQGCDGVPCLVGRATALVRSMVKTSGEGLKARPLDEVLKSGSAGIAEQAGLVRLLLERAGLVARLAFTADRAGRAVQNVFPILSRFDHVLVWLPRQEGLSQPMFVDPDCPYCASGELTARHQGAQALAATVSDGIAGTKVQADWLVLSGPRAPGSSRERTAELDLRGPAGPTLTTTERLRGLEGRAHAARKASRPKAAWERELRQKAAQGSMLAAWRACARTGAARRRAPATSPRW